eukprot:2472934-Rhodomonas_salina.1
MIWACSSQLAPQRTQTLTPRSDQGPGTRVVVVRYPGYPRVPGGYNSEGGGTAPNFEVRPTSTSSNRYLAPMPGMFRTKIEVSALGLGIFPSPALGLQNGRLCVPGEAARAAFRGVSEGSVNLRSERTFMISRLGAGFGFGTNSPPLAKETALRTRRCPSVSGVPGVVPCRSLVVVLPAVPQS